MKKYIITVPVYVVLLLTPILTILGSNPAAAGSQPATFFSHGQAVDDPQDHAKSQQQAIQDFMAQGLTQAIASFLSPTQMGTQFSDLQKKLLAKPSKYIDSYQVISQSQTDGMFQVVGQVTVSMDALKKGLEESGILVAQQKPPAPAASSPVLNAAAAASEDDNNQDEEDAEPSVEPDDSKPPVEEASQSPIIAPGASRPASRGIAATRREILWVVPEKWEQEWEVPTDGSDVRSFFARSLGKEMEDLEFSILLPQPGSVRMDLSGNVPSSQVISLAEGLGIQDVVVGKVSYMQDRNSKQAWLDASLRVIRIGQGKSEFELHKTQSIEDISNQEGALELAAQVAPQLSSLLGGSQAGGVQRGGADSAGPGQEVASSQPGSVGPLTVYLPSAQYLYWKELEGILREQFKNMQITSLEIGSTQGVVKLDGVSGDYILKMSGTALPSGATVRIESYSTETQTMKVSFAPPGNAQAETK
ncbi:MAG: hypothetical protein ACLP3B_25620 [Syntrophobacteraceae bacterium]